MAQKLERKLFSELSGYVLLCLPIVSLTQVVFQALEGLSNGAMRDVRVIGLSGTDWLSKYNNQGAFLLMSVMLGTKMPGCS